MSTFIQPFVDWEWYAHNRAHITMVDARWYLDGSSGMDAYRAGHIPGAVFVDLDQWLSGPASPERGRNPLPDPAVFAEGMGQAGINASSTVIAYDDAGGVIAARLVWMLRASGVNAALLNGGMGSYPGKLITEVPPVPKAEFTARAWPANMLAEISDAASGEYVTVDARNRDRFEGMQDPIDPRPGHIPGAVNVPCRGNLDCSGKLLPDAEIRAKFDQAGVASAENTISYCGSGVTACHNLLVMEHLGMGAGKLFVGGWSQYGHAMDMPVETV